MKAFQGLGPKLIIVGVFGVWLSFFLAYHSNITCYVGQVPVSQNPVRLSFNCPDANYQIEYWNYYVIAPVLGIVVFVASYVFEFRWKMKVEFWTTLSILALALVVMPLYTLLATANGIDTG